MNHSAIATGRFTVISEHKPVERGPLAGWKAITVIGAPLREADPSRYLEAFIKLTLMANRWYETRNPWPLNLSLPFGRSRAPVSFAFLFISIPRFARRRFAVVFTRGATFNKRVLTSVVLSSFSLSLSSSLPLQNHLTPLPPRRSASLSTSARFLGATKKTDQQCSLLRWKSNDGNNG